MLNIDSAVMAHITEAAKTQTGGDARWCNAIDRAAHEIETNPYLHFAGGVLTLLSSTSNNIYDANRTCECKAFEFGNPCWHRACARLLRRYYEAQACGALWTPKSHGDADGETETTIPLDASVSAPRRWFGSAGEFETLAAHERWCEGCRECWLKAA